MSLKIRMSRAGTKKRPYYRIVIAESRSPRDGRFIERVGSYNPLLPRENPQRVVLNVERIKHWLGVGATPSERVQHFLAAVELAAKPERHEQTKQHLPRKKTQERLKAAADKAGAAEAPAS